MNVKTTQTDLMRIRQRIRESVRRRENNFNEIPFSDSVKEHWFNYMRKTEQIKRLLVPLEFMISECEDLISAMKNDHNGGTKKEESG